MRTYRLVAKAFEDKKKLIIWEYSLYALMIVIGISEGSRENSILHWHVTLPIALIVSYVQIKVKIIEERRDWENYLLEINDEVIINTQNETDKIEIAFDEITEIRRDSLSVFIKTKEKSRNIFIPKELEAFEEVTDEIEFRTQSTAKVPKIKNPLSEYLGLIVIVIGLISILYISIDKIIAVVTSIPLIIFLIWSMAFIQKSNVTDRVKRSSFLMVIVVLAIISRLYYVLTYTI